MILGNAQDVTRSEMTVQPAGTGRHSATEKQEPCSPRWARRWQQAELFHDPVPSLTTIPSPVAQLNPEGRRPPD